MSIFNNENWAQHESVVFKEDAKTGLRAIIAVHSTVRGPAMGGCRMFNYTSESNAISDVLRLSEGMTFKNALADLPIGGGKAVIIGDPKKATPELFQSMGRFVQELGGRYITAEDSGTSVSAMQQIASETAFVTGVDASQEHAGDPSPSTALGVYLSMQEAVKRRFGQSHLSGLIVGIQGLGNVGIRLAEHLINAGVEVVGADVNQDNIDRARMLGVRIVDPAQILSAQVDVLAPCAMGAIINQESIAQMRAGLICGAANNQLSMPGVEVELQKREILYAPDFVINSGGIIDAFAQYAPDAGIDVSGKIAAIPSTLGAVLDYAAERNELSGKAAIEVAKQRVANPEFKLTV